MVKEFILVSVEKYDKLRQSEDNSHPFKEDSLLNRDVSEAKDSEKVTSVSVEQMVTESSMLSQNELHRYIKSKVGNVFQDKVDLLFEFLLSHPSVLKWTNFGEAIVNRNRITCSDIYDILDIIFHHQRKLSKQSPPRGLEELIRGLSLPGFDPNSLVNRRVKAIMSTMHKQNVSPGVKKVRAKAVRKTLIKCPINFFCQSAKYNLQDGSSFDERVIDICQKE